MSQLVEYQIFREDHIGSHAFLTAVRADNDDRALIKAGDAVRRALDEGKLQLTDKITVHRPDDTVICAPAGAEEFQEK